MTVSIVCLGTVIGWMCSTKRIPKWIFFGDSKVIKNASSKDIENYILERLGDVFPAVAANPKVFVNEKTVSNVSILLCSF